MAFNKKTWKNRISENPLRRIITNVTTGVSETVDVTRYEGIITEAGDAFSAANMNDLESRIEQGINDAGSSDIIAATEEGPLSAHAYTIGQYLIYNKINYRVVQPIAVGNSLVPGTNLVEKKVADELSNHLVVNGNAFYFDVHNGEYGYNTSESRGADTFVPFKRLSGSFIFLSAADGALDDSVNGTTSVTKPNVYYGTTQFLYVYPGNYKSLLITGGYSGWTNGCKIWKVKRDGTWSLTTTNAPVNPIDLTDCIGLFAVMYLSGAATVTLS